MNMRFSAGFVVLFLSLAAADLAAAGWDSKRERAALATIEEFKDTNRKMVRLFSETWGYAVFPNVGKGGIGIGGAYGRGVVFEKGTAIGTTKLYQVSIGLQFGGQAYSEVVFFQHKTAMDKFKAGNFIMRCRIAACPVKALCDGFV